MRQWDTPLKAKLQCIEVSLHPTYTLEGQKGVKLAIKKFENLLLPRY